LLPRGAGFRRLSCADTAALSSGLLLGDRRVEVGDVVVAAATKSVAAWSGARISPVAESVFRYTTEVLGSVFSP
jgi:hypothetical protein